MMRKECLLVLGVCLGLVVSGVDVKTITETGSGYNSWSFLGVVGKRVVCTYSRGRVHTTNENGRGTYVRCSDDGGETWRPERAVMYSPEFAGVAEGMGNDLDGKVLLWIRYWRKGKVEHKLLRSADGEKYEFVGTMKMDPVPTQVMDVVRLQGNKLMSLWFAGDYRGGKGNSWGTLISADNGKTWTQRVVEKGLAQEDWPTEQSAVTLGGGRILVIGRREWGGKNRVQFQMESDDNGATWRKMRTNIDNIAESTPALIYDRETGVVSNYYYQRGAGILWRRRAKLADVWGNATNWGPCEEVARASTNSYHAGNVKAVACGGKHFLTIYSGDSKITDILIVRD